MVGQQNGNFSVERKKCNRSFEHNPIILTWELGDADILVYANHLVTDS